MNKPMRIGNSYLQFTKKLPAMQRGRVEKTLDVEYNVARIGVVTLKDWIVHTYLTGGTTEQEDDYSTYNQRTGDYTKPKTVYWLMPKEGGSYQISKTAYNFMEYLQRLKATVKDIENCIKIEERQAEQARQAEIQRMEQEKIDKQREREERKKVFEEKKQEYIKAGYPIVEPHLPKIYKMVEDYMIQIDDVENTESTKKTMAELLSWYTGNPTILKDQVTRYITSLTPEDNNRGSHGEFYKNVYKTLTGVEETDSGQTASAKIRALISGKQYQPTKPKQKHKIHKKTESGYEIVECDKLMANKHPMMVHHNEERGTWEIIEPKTGLLLMSKATKTKLMESFKATSFYTNPEFQQTSMQKFVDKHGLAPEV